MRLVALLLALLPTFGHAADRVVSINLCTDQIAMMLAAPGQLVSVSKLAADPMLSSMATEARAFPANRGQAEQVFMQRPDLVLASPYSSRAVVGLLRRMGVRVEEITPPMTVEEVAVQILATGHAMGRETEASALAARFSADLAALARRDRGTAASYQPNGHTAGPGSMGDAIMALAGWRNIAAGDVLPLEVLVMAKPDLLILSETWPGASRAEELLRHPALAGTGGRVARSGADWICGTPYLLRAVEAISR